jgi:AcrR family transcriptional regulator
MVYRATTTRLLELIWVFRSDNMNICSCSYYENSALSLRSCNLVRGHPRSPDRRTAPASPWRLDWNTYPVRGQFPSDGLGCAPFVPQGSLAAGAMACGRDLNCAADVVARSVLQRVLSGGVSEYGSCGRRSFRGLDALVLRGGAGRGDDWSGETGVNLRPNLLAGEDLPPGPRQKRSLEKRARLKEAGLVLFGEKGYESTSIDEIARRAKLAVGTFYQHFRSKRQLLLALMDELLEKLSQLDFRPRGVTDVRAVVHELLARAFSHDLRYLGAYRAWQEAVLSDPDFARKQVEIHAWTTARVAKVFQLLQQLPGARAGVDVPGLARVMDSFFWSLLGRAVLMPDVELKQWIDSATHLIYHAMFVDPARRAQRLKPS